MPPKTSQNAQNGPIPCPEPTVRRSCRFLRREFDYSLLHQIDSKNIDEWGIENCLEEIKRWFAWEVAKTKPGPSYYDGDAYLLWAMERVADGKARRRGEESVAEMLKALWLRAKIRSSFLSVFMHLNRIGLVSLEGLEKPMCLSHISDEDVRDVSAALYSFEKTREISDFWSETFPDHDAFETWFTPMQGYPTPLDWLATLIIRGTLVTDLGVIMDAIENFGEFGALDRQRVERVLPEGKELVRNRDANIFSRDLEPGTRDGDSPVVAFWLPYELGPNVTVESIYREFDDEVFIPLEDLFFRFFGLKKGKYLRNEMLPASLLRESIGGVIGAKWNT